jgi:tRNA pseudouridine13 synthase
MHIKERPEDFIVIEHGDVRHDKDDCIIVEVEKRNWDTTLLVKEMAKRYGVSQASIGYAGLKDKHAVTKQKMSIFGVSEEKIRRTVLPDAKVEVLGRGDRIEVGDLLGNEFAITVRGIGGPYEDVLGRLEEHAGKMESFHGFINYFGYQRFGIQRPVTADVGKAIVLKDYRHAVDTYIGGQYPLDPHKDIRKAYLDGMEPKEAYEAFPHSLKYERAMLFSLAESGGDPIKALHSLPSRLLMLFVHAYQSQLFNEIVERRVAEIPPNEAEIGDMIVMDRQGTRAFTYVNKSNYKAVQGRLQSDVSVACPLIGYRTVLPKSLMGEISRDVLETEGIVMRDFENARHQVMSSSGSGREILARYSDFAYDLSKEADSCTCSLSFFLPKGSYATEFLRQLFGEDVLPPEVALDE